MSDVETEKLKHKVLLEIEGELQLLQAVLVDASIFARKRGYDCIGWDALYVLFAERFAWTPEKVRSLKIEEMSWLLDTFFPV